MRIGFRFAAFAEFVEHFSSAALLRVVGIQYFDPGFWCRRVGSILVLADNALAIAVADGLEEAGADALDMVRIEHSRNLAGFQYLPQRRLTVEQWQRPEVYAVTPGHVEDVIECGLGSAHQVHELGAPIRTQAHDFAVQDRVLDLESGQGLREPGEALVDDIFPGDQAADSIFYVGLGSEAIMLEFPNEVRIVKSGSDSSRCYGCDPGQHDLIVAALASASGRV